jgi:Escherichia/Staphylococcus phage prohead protease
VFAVQWKQRVGTLPLRDPAGPYERRGITPEVAELRVSAPEEPPRIGGYAALFNSRSHLMNERGAVFVERIEPGAFTKTLKQGDVRALLNHDPNWLLGRTKSGTLRLVEDDRGLSYEIDPPNTQWARDLMTTMRRGDIDGSSFSFQATREAWGTAEIDGAEVDERRLIEVRLYDVSPVTFPAYPATTSGVRSFGAGVVDDLSAEDWRALKVFIRGLRSAPGQTAHPLAHSTPAPGQTAHPGGVDMGRYRRWLERVKTP